MEKAISNFAASLNELLIANNNKKFRICNQADIRYPNLSYRVWNCEFR